MFSAVQIRGTLICLMIAIGQGAADTPTTSSSTTTTTTTTTTTASPSTTTTAPTTTEPNTLTYSCDASGEITVQLPSQYIAVEAFGGSNKNKCSIPDDSTTQTTNGNVTLTNCAPQSPIYLYIGSSSSILGGKHYHEFVIDCRLPASGVLKTVQAKVSSILTEPVSTITLPSVAPTFTLTMTIKPDSGKISVGDQLELKFSEAGKYFVVPQTCIAYVENKEDVNITIYNKTVGFRDDNIMDSFNLPATGGAPTANLYAFVFRQHESEAVVIQCTVKVCPSKTCGDPVTRRRRSLEKGDNQLQYVSGRNRRSAVVQSNHQSHVHSTHTLTASFRVSGVSSGQNRLAFSGAFLVLGLLFHRIH